MVVVLFQISRLQGHIYRHKHHVHKSLCSLKGVVEMKTIGESLLLVLFLCSLAIGAFAQEVEPISFATMESTVAATRRLHDEGIRVFMDEVWKQGVAAPGIHSKYWLDQFTGGKPELARLEKAYRDFGHEVAIQVEDLAFEIYEKPDKALEPKRLDWLLRFSKWLMKPGRFENFRIGMRIEDAATMPLHRVIFNFDIPTDIIDSYFLRFTTARESATFRANILYEESDGVLDVRNLAKKVEDEEDDGFEAKWLALHRKAFKYFGDFSPEYTLDPELVRDEQIKYSFFTDDSDFLCSRDCIHERWDFKCHKAVCIYRTTASYLMQLANVLTFRKEIGGFPEVDIQSGKDAYKEYEDFYFKKFNWEEKLSSVSARSVAALYLDYKSNQYKDASTYFSQRTKQDKTITLEQFETWHTTKARRARNKQWLEKNGKLPKEK